MRLMLGNRAGLSLRQVNLAWRYPLHELVQTTIGRFFLIEINARSRRIRSVMSTVA
jgi:hypothetical protein